MIGRISFTIGLIICAGLYAYPSGSLAQSADKPNVLWIFVEDTSPWMPIYGDQTVSTPMISKLAQSGVAFSNAFAPNPICSPTRSGLIAGAHPAEIGVHNHRGSRDPEGRDAIHLPPGHKTVPQLLAQAGYKTFNIGKDDYNFVYDRRDLYNTGPAGVEGHIGERMGPEFNWIAEVGDDPFFGQIQLQGDKSKKPAIESVPPENVQLPEYYPDTMEFRQYYARHYETIAITDREVREIVASLEKAGLLDDTVIFIFADHGMRLLRHKQFLYDGGVHVPLIVSGTVPEDRMQHMQARSDDLVSLIDVAATTVALAGIDVPDYFFGQNLAGEPYAEREYLIFSRDRADYTFDRIRAVRTDRYKYIRNYFPERPYLQTQYRSKWPVTRSWKNAFESGNLAPEASRFMKRERPVEELYDLRADPEETNNLAAHPAYQEQIEHLRGILDDWILSGRDKGQIPETTQEIEAVLDRWGERCVSPECSSVRALRNQPEEDTGRN